MSSECGFRTRLCVALSISVLALVPVAAPFHLHPCKDEMLYLTRPLPRNNDSCNLQHQDESHSGVLSVFLFPGQHARRDISFSLPRCKIAGSRASLVLRYLVLEPSEIFVRIKLVLRSNRLANRFQKFHVPLLVAQAGLVTHHMLVNEGSSLEGLSLSYCSKTRMSQPPASRDPLRMSDFELRLSLNSYKVSSSSYSSSSSSSSPAAVRRSPSNLFQAPLIQEGPDRNYMETRTQTTTSHPSSSEDRSLQDNKPLTFTLKHHTLQYFNRITDQVPSVERAVIGTFPRLELPPTTSASETMYSSSSSSSHHHLVRNLRWQVESSKAEIQGFLLQVDFAQFDTHPSCHASIQIGFVSRAVKEYVSYHVAQIPGSDHSFHLHATRRSCIRSPIQEFSLDVSLTCRDSTELAQVCVTPRGMTPQPRVPGTWDATASSTTFAQTTIWIAFALGGVFFVLVIVFIVRYRLTSALRHSSSTFAPGATMTTSPEEVTWRVLEPEIDILCVNPETSRSNCMEDASKVPAFHMLRDFHACLHE